MRVQDEISKIAILKFGCERSGKNLITFFNDKLEEIFFFEIDELNNINNYTKNHLGPINNIWDINDFLCEMAEKVFWIQRYVSLTYWQEIIKRLIKKKLSLKKLFAFASVYFLNRTTLMTVLDPLPLSQSLTIWRRESGCAYQYLHSNWWLA